MTGKEYVQLASRTNDGMSTQRLREMIIFNPKIGDALNGVIGLTGEAGEVSDMIKKWAFHGHELDVEHIKKELGDVMWYVHMICTAFELDLDEVMAKNIDKLRARYPEGFDTERSLHRQEGDI